MGRFLMAEEILEQLLVKIKYLESIKAKEMIEKVGKENVANATVGSLLDEEGNLVVLSSVVEVLKDLNPLDYAEYAPIAGLPKFLESVKKLYLWIMNLKDISRLLRHQVEQVQSATQYKIILKGRHNPNFRLVLEPI